MNGFYNRSAFQKLIEEHFDVGVEKFTTGNRVLLDALVDGESIQGVDGHIDSVNGIVPSNFGLEGVA